MGNLTNPVSLRLRLNIYWNSVWVSYNNNNYSFLLSSDFLLYSYIKWFISKKIFLSIGCLFFYSHFKILRTSERIFVTFFIKDYKFYKFFFEYVNIILKLRSNISSIDRTVNKHVNIINAYNTAMTMPQNTFLSKTYIKSEMLPKSTFFSFCWLFLFFDLQKVFFKLAYNKFSKSIEKTIYSCHNIFYFKNFIYLFYLFIFIYLVFFLSSRKFSLTFNTKIYDNYYLLYYLFIICFSNFNFFVLTHSSFFIINSVSFGSSLFIHNKNFIVNNMFFIKKVPIFINNLHSKLLTKKKFFFQNFNVKNIVFKRLRLYSYCVQDSKNLKKKNIKHLFSFFRFSNIFNSYFKYLYKLKYIDNKFNIPTNPIKYIKFLIDKIKFLIVEGKKNKTSFQHLFLIRRLVRRTLKIILRKNKLLFLKFSIIFFGFSSYWICLIIAKLFKFKLNNNVNYLNYLLNLSNTNNRKLCDLFNYNLIFNNFLRTDLFFFNFNKLLSYIRSNSFNYIYKLYIFMYIKYLIFLNIINKYKELLFKFFKSNLLSKNIKFYSKNNKFIKNKFNFVMLNYRYIIKKLLLKQTVIINNNYYRLYSIRYKKSPKVINLSKISDIFFSLRNLFAYRRLIFSRYNKRVKKYLLLWRFNYYIKYNYIYNYIYSPLTFTNIWTKYSSFRIIKIKKKKVKYYLKKNLTFFFNKYIIFNKIIIKNACVLNNNIYFFLKNIVNNALILLIFRKLVISIFSFKYSLNIENIRKMTINKNNLISYQSRKCVKNKSNNFYYFYFFFKYLNMLLTCKFNLFLMPYLVNLKKLTFNLYLDIQNKTNFIFFLKLFHLKLFEIFSYFSVNFREVLKYRIFFFKFLYLLKYASKTLHIAKFSFNNFKIKSLNIFILKKKNIIINLIKKKKGVKILNNIMITNLIRKYLFPLILRFKQYKIFKFFKMFNNKQPADIKFSSGPIMFLKNIMRSRSHSTGKKNYPSRGNQNNNIDNIMDFDFEHIAGFKRIAFTEKAGYETLRHYLNTIGIKKYDKALYSFYNYLFWFIDNKYESFLEQLHIIETCVLSNTDKPKAIDDKYLSYIRGVRFNYYLHLDALKSKDHPVSAWNPFEITYPSGMFSWTLRIFWFPHEYRDTYPEFPEELRDKKSLTRAERVLSYQTEKCCFTLPNIIKFQKGKLLSWLLNWDCMLLIHDIESHTTPNELTKTPLKYWYNKFDKILKIFKFYRLMIERFDNNSKHIPEIQSRKFQILHSRIKAHNNKIILEYIPQAKKRALAAKHAALLSHLEYTWSCNSKIKAQLNRYTTFRVAIDLNFLSFHQEILWGLRALFKDFSATVLLQNLIIQNLNFLKKDYNVVEYRYYKYRIYLYNTFNLAYKLKQNKKKYNFWVLFSNINSLIFFYNYNYKNIPKAWYLKKINNKIYNKFRDKKKKTSFFFEIVFSTESFNTLNSPIKKINSVYFPDILMKCWPIITKFVNLEKKTALYRLKKNRKKSIKVFFYK